MNLYGSDLFGFPREWFSEERDDADVLAPPRFWIVAPRSFLLPDDEDDDFDDDVDPLNREHHREGEEKEATKTLILFSHTNTHTHLSLCVCVCVCVGFSLKTLSLCVTAVRALYFIEHLTRNERKIFSPRKRKEERHAHVLGLKTLNKKKPPKISLRTKMHRRATRRDPD
jgi:hypothetical protein